MGQRTRRISQNAANSFANSVTTQSLSTSSNVQFNAITSTDATITGNLTVSGTTTHINTTEFSANVDINAVLEVNTLKTSACSAIMLGYGTGIQANGTYGDPGQVLTNDPINGVYWGNVPAGYSNSDVANYLANNNVIVTDNHTVTVNGYISFDSYSRVNHHEINSSGRNLSIKNGSNTYQYYSNYIESVHGNQRVIMEQAIGQTNYSFFGMTKDAILGAKTLNNTPVYLNSDLLVYPNGYWSPNASGYYMVNGEVARIKVNVVAAPQPTTTFTGLKTWEIAATAYKAGNIIVIMQESKTYTEFGDTTGWDVAIDSDNMHIGVKVTGSSANVHWTAKMELVTEVITGAAGGK